MEPVKFFVTLLSISSSTDALEWIADEWVFRLIPFLVRSSKESASPWLLYCLMSFSRILGLKSVQGQAEHSVEGRHIWWILLSLHTWLHQIRRRVWHSVLRIQCFVWCLLAWKITESRHLDDLAVPLFDEWTASIGTVVIGHNAFDRVLAVETALLSKATSTSRR